MSDAPTAIFTVTNHHVASCGRPPQIDGDRDVYHGYFENRYGAGHPDRYGFTEPAPAAR